MSVSMMVIGTAVIWACLQLVTLVYQPTNLKTNQSLATWDNIVVMGPPLEWIHETISTQSNHQIEESSIRLGVYFYEYCPFGQYDPTVVKGGIQYQVYMATRNLSLADECVQYYGHAERIVPIGLEMQQYLGYTDTNVAQDQNPQDHQFDSVSQVKNQDNGQAEAGDDFYPEEDQFAAFEQEILDQNEELSEAHQQQQFESSRQQIQSQILNSIKMSAQNPAQAEFKPHIPFQQPQEHQTNDPVATVFTEQVYPFEQPELNLPKHQQQTFQDMQFGAINSLQQELLLNIKKTIEDIQQNQRQQLIVQYGQNNNQATNQPSNQELNQPNAIHSAEIDTANIKDLEFNDIQPQNILMTDSIMGVNLLLPTMPELPILDDHRSQQSANQQQQKNDMKGNSQVINQNKKTISEKSKDFEENQTKKNIEAQKQSKPIEKNIPTVQNPKLTEKAAPTIETPKTVEKAAQTIETPKPTEKAAPTIETLKQTQQKAAPSMETPKTTEKAAQTVQTSKTIDNTIPTVEAPKQNKQTIETPRLNQQTVETAKANQQTVPTVQAPKPTEKAIPTHQAPKNNRQTIPTVKDPKPAENVVPIVETPKPTEKACSTVETAKPAEKIVPNGEAPKPSEKVVPTVETPKPTEQVTKTVELSKPNQQTVPTAETPKPTEKVVPTVETPKTTEKVLPTVLTPKPTEKDIPKVQPSIPTVEVSNPTQKNIPSDPVSKVNQHTVAPQIHEHPL